MKSILGPLQLAIVVLAALIVVSAASAGTGWVKLAGSSDRSPDASVTLLTLYPILSGGQQPHNAFIVVLIAKPAQRLKVDYNVQCAKGTDDVTRTYPSRLVSATPSGKRYRLRTPVANADYCSVTLTAAGSRYVKAALFGYGYTR